MRIADDSGLLLEVLKIYDDHLVVAGRGGHFSIRPSPEKVSLTFDLDDPLNLVRAAQALGYDPIFIEEGG